MNAGIPKTYVYADGTKWKLDFHASLTRYINFVLETCGNLKTAMTHAGVNTSAAFTDPNGLRSMNDAQKLKENRDNLRSAMEHARHTDDDFTLNVYGQSSHQQASEAAEVVRSKISSNE